MPELLRLAKIACKLKEKGLVLSSLSLDRESVCHVLYELKSSDNTIEQRVLLIQNAIQSSTICYLDIRSVRVCNKSTLEGKVMHVFKKQKNKKNSHYFMLEKKKRRVKE